MYALPTSGSNMYREIDYRDKVHFLFYSENPDLSGQRVLPESRNERSNPCSRLSNHLSVFLSYMQLSEKGGNATIVSRSTKHTEILKSLTSNSSDFQGMLPLALPQMESLTG